MKNNTKEKRMIDRFMGYNKPDGVTGTYQSWDELMKVVIKLESLGYNIIINGLVCTVTIPKDNPLEVDELITIEFEKSKFESVYSACVTAIEHNNIAKFI